MYTVTRVADKKLYKIEREGMPAYFTNSFRDVGTQLAEGRVSLEEICFLLDRTDEILIKTIYHSRMAFSSKKC